MGRYVYGDFEYKFAFGDQSSSFGDVLEEIAGDNSITRMADEDCEDVILNITNPQMLIKNIKEYVKGFKPMSKNEQMKWTTCQLKKGDEYWNKYMMKAFLKKHEKNILDGKYSEMHFCVEY